MNGLPAASGTCPVDPALSAPASRGGQRLALLGMPNAGKSTFFNRLAGATAQVGNWPGITVDLGRAMVTLNGRPVEVVDLPGVYDLRGRAADEQVVRDFLQAQPVDLAIAILNATQLDRHLRLLLQLKALGLPLLALLNMADEAQRLGIAINTEELAAQLGVPVCLFSAKYGGGYFDAYLAIAQQLAATPAAMAIPDLDARLAAAGAIDSAQVTAALAASLTAPPTLENKLTQRLDALLLHPLLGLPLFFLGLFATFWLIWQVGLPAQGWVDDLAGWLQAQVLEPLLTFLPPWGQSLVLEGVWSGVATVASFVPLIVVFFMALAVLEDSGYLARSAYLMDAWMARLGLDGRSFVMQILGFGCNVPALMGTRTLRSPALRRLTMLTIPFTLCSARLQVFVFIIAAVFPNGNGALVLASLYLLSFLATFLTAALFQSAFPNDEPFILELPPYRRPTWGRVLLRGWGEVREFLRRTWRFILLGCVGLWALTHLPVGATGLDTLGGRLGLGLQPLMRPLGIDPYLTLALLFGFLAKEVTIGSLAAIYGLGVGGASQQVAATVTLAQGYSFCIFCLLYTPCLTTLATLWQEAQSWPFTLLSLVLSLVLAWLGSFLFYQTVLAWG